MCWISSSLATGGRRHKGSIRTQKKSKRIISRLDEEIPGLAFPSLLIIHKIAKAKSNNVKMKIKGLMRPICPAKKRHRLSAPNAKAILKRRFRVINSCDLNQP